MNRYLDCLRVIRFLMPYWRQAASRDREGYPFVGGEFVPDVVSVEHQMDSEDKDELNVLLYEVGELRTGKEQTIVEQSGWFFGLQIVLSERREMAQLMRDEYSRRHLKIECDVCGCPYEPATVGPYKGWVSPVCRNDWNGCNTKGIYEISDNGRVWKHCYYQSQFDKLIDEAMNSKN